jgi:DNA-binding IclR family transcriptional regulator
MVKWSFLTNHARVLLCIAHDPGVRLRDIGAALDITERSAHTIVTQLAEEGYVIKQKDGRRNRYQIQAHLPLHGTVGRERTIGEILDVLVEASAANSDPLRDPPTGQTSHTPARARWLRNAQTQQQN